MSDIFLVLSAAAFAAECHKGQVRKELPDPYINHPIRVAKMAAQLQLPDTDIAAALLHDVVEDTPTPFDTIARLYPGRTATLVCALTKWWGESHPSEVVSANKKAYYENILRTDGAVILKVLDRIDNLYDFAKMARLTPSNHKWAGRYLKKSQAEFAPLIMFLSVRSDSASMTAVQWYENALRSLEDSL